MGGLMSDKDVQLAGMTVGLLLREQARIQSHRLERARGGTMRPGRQPAVQIGVACRVDPTTDRTRGLFGSSELVDQASHVVTFPVGTIVNAGDVVTIGARSYRVTGTDEDRSNAFVLSALVKETGFEGAAS